MHHASALLIIDMQHDFAVPGGACEVPGAHATIPAIRRVLLRYRELDWPIFHITRAYLANSSTVERSRLQAFAARPMVVPGTLGCSFAPGLEPLGHEYHIVKPRFSAFMATELDLILRRLGVRQVVVTGTQLPFCLRTTLFDGLCLDYDMLLLTDATSSRTPEIHAANIQDITDVGICCTTVDNYLTTLPG